MKIGIMSLYYSENLGEELYTETVKKICGKEIKDITFEIIDIHGRDCGYVKTSIIQSLLKKIGLRNLELAIRKQKENTFLRNYYKKKMKGCSGIIIPGGGYIKSAKKDKWDSYHRYDAYFTIMAKLAKKENIKIYFNAVGHVDTGNDELEIKIWKKVFHLSSVGFLTCRDELPFFKASYGEKAKRVCCSAAFAGELFDIKKKEKTNTIGIGIIRPENFTQYGFNITKKELVRLMIDLVLKLESEGFEVKVFTNGLKADYQFGVEIQKELNRNDLLIERPNNCVELIRTISAFKAVIVSRMHAAIAAYSLDIPAITMSWNNKHEEFMSGAGVKEWAVYPENFVVTTIINLLKNAIEKGWPKKERSEYRKTGYDSIKDICNMIKEENN